MILSVLCVLCALCGEFPVKTRAYRMAPVHTEGTQLGFLENTEVVI